jgi:sugar phosphate isomerase/epimerase
VDRPNCGLLIDSWHVFRAGTSLEELRSSLTADIIFGVELDDADPHVGGSLFEDTINNRRLCGRGSFDLIGLVSLLSGLGYRGPWGVEIISNAHRALELTDALQSAATTARRILEAC